MSLITTGPPGPPGPPGKSSSFPSEIHVVLLSLLQQIGAAASMLPLPEAWKNASQRGMNYNFKMARLGDRDIDGPSMGIKNSWIKDDSGPSQWSSDRAVAPARWRQKETMPGGWGNTNTLSDINIYNVAFLEHTTLPPVKRGL